MSLIHSKMLKHGVFEVHDTKPSFEFVHVVQVHGIDIITQDSTPQNGDGILSQYQELERPLAIKTADCIPAAIEGKNQVVFLHAGWRGVAQRIFETGEVKSINPHYAYIGPSIRPCCYEVSKEFKENFPGSKNFIERDGKTFFDLQNEAKDQILSLYPKIEIEIAQECTMCNPNFHSFRRNATSERNWNLYRKGN